VFLGIIPEELFLSPDADHVVDQASREKIGISPYNFIDFLLQQFKVGLEFMLFDKFADRQCVFVKGKGKSEDTEHVCQSLRRQDGCIVSSKNVKEQINIER
jgi:hypothetical protein